jgi:CRP/FNR family cyclic AMP-dependent transcriptional regulator
MEQTIDLVLPTSRDSQFKTLTFEPGMILVRAGQPLLGLITVIKGRLKRKRPYPAGEFLVGIAGPGDRIGVIELLESMSYVEGPRHGETLETIGHVEVQIEPASAVEVRLRAFPKELRELMTKSVGNSFQKVAKPSRYSSKLRRPLDLMPVKARVAATLWNLMNSHGVRVADGVLLDLDLTREEIAHLAGTVYESVIRMLTKFKNDGMIHLEGRKILIKDETLLARTAQIVLDRPEIKPESSNEALQTGVDRHDSRSDKEAVVQNHSSKDNGSSQEAC